CVARSLAPGRAVRLPFGRQHRGGNPRRAGNGASKCSSHEQIKGVEEVIDLESKVQPDIIQETEADPLASEWVRYLAAIAMTAAATVVAIGVDSKVNIPNLSLVFVVPVIVAGVSLRLGPSLCSAILG